MNVISHLVFFMLGVVSLAHAAPQRPNILFFLVDDMGVADTSVSFHAHRGEAVTMPLNARYRTPQMEKLSKMGRVFTRAYAYSVCSPTRISLLTGHSALRHRVTTWTDPKVSTVDTGFFENGDIRTPSDWNKEGVDRRVLLLPQMMKQAGYDTLFAGKAHFGPDDTPNGNPINLGFDLNIAGFGGGGPGSYLGRYAYSANWRGGGTRWDVPGLEKYHETDTFLTEAITLEMNQAIAQSVNNNKNFFAYMSHYAVHAPFETDPRFEAHYEGLSRKELAFATLVEGMDKSLGDMLAHLESLGVAEETLVIFFSDNGSAGPLNLPLRGKKGQRHEGGVRVPLMVSWAKVNPEHPLQRKFPIKSGSVEHRMVTCLDMVPTILNFAGVEPSPTSIMDGQSVLPYVLGEQDCKRPSEFLVHFPHKHSHKLFSAYWFEEWKVIYSYITKSWELYDLDQDPYESKDLSRSAPEKLKVMASRMIRKLDEGGAQYPIDVKTNESIKPHLN